MEDEIGKNDLTKKEAAWRELLAKDEVKEVEFDTSFGKVVIGIKLPGWTELERMRDNCTTIDNSTRQIKFDNVRYTQEKLRKCIVKHPFPPEQLDTLLLSLSSRVVRKIMAAIEEEEGLARDTAKN
ncbi:MAG: hypothetical protein WC350_05510 [Candidatus Micrarchaeia archaeon]|jgi:hypothetical protein